jgi:hypothetical protein
MRELYYSGVAGIPEKLHKSSKEKKEGIAGDISTVVRVQCFFMLKT